MRGKRGSNELHEQRSAMNEGTTGNRAGGDACPARDRGGSMIHVGTRELHQHAHSHARSPLETIMSEQRPGGEGSRVPAKERRQ